MTFVFTRSLMLMTSCFSAVATLYSFVVLTSYGERGGSVVERRTPEREVGGSKPTSAVLCP